MIGIGGKFASSKGMVAVPSIIGLTVSQAHIAIQNSGLEIGTQGSTSGSSSQNGKLASQTTPSGTLVDYESTIGFAVYLYTAPSAPSGPYLVSTNTGPNCGTVLATGIISQICVGNNYVTIVGTQNVTTYRYNYSDGTSSSGYSVCFSGQQESSVPSQACADRNAPPPPPPVPSNCTSCTNGSYTYSGSDSGCASGNAWYSVCIFNSGCQPASSTSRNCVPVPRPPEPVKCKCTSGCGATWSGACSGGTQLQAIRCTACDCSSSVRSWTNPC